MSSSKHAEAPKWLIEKAERSPSSFAQQGSRGKAGRRLPLDGGSIHYGERGDTLFREACADRARGLEYPEILERTEQRNRERCNPSIGEHPEDKDPRELERIARSACRYPAGKATLAPDAETLDALLEVERNLMRSEWPGLGGKSERDVVVALIKLARRHSRLIEEGIRVSVSVRDLALAAAMSKRSVQRVIKRLLDARVISRILPTNEGESGAFVLRRAKCHHSNHMVSSIEEQKGGDSLRAPLTAPRLRWSAPGIKRLGKTCGAVIDYLERAGGSAEVEELAELLHVSRTRDFKRRIISRLEAAEVVECAGNTVSLVGNWIDYLNHEREVAGEIAAYRRDMDRYNREQEAYRKRRENKPDRAPTQEEMRDCRNSYPDRRRQAIEVAIARLFTEHPEYRGRRAGQITCRLVFYLPEDFPRGRDGAPKDAEVEAILDGAAA